VHNIDDNVVEVQKVSFSYNGNEVLQDIDLAIHRGDYLGLVGGNGAGKTTLLRIILGLLSASAGSVRLFGSDISDFSDWSKIGYVPQKATSFDAKFPATAFEVVLMGLYGKRGLFRHIRGTDKELALKALALVEMEDESARLIGTLSGGEQQRVFIARALVSEPEILFLDEPTVGVEKNVRDAFYALLRRLNEDLHLTVVLVTHDIESIAHEAMHIACIDRTLEFCPSAAEFLREGHSITQAHHL